MDTTDQLERGENGPPKNKGRRLPRERRVRREKELIMVQTGRGSRVLRSGEGGAYIQSAGGQSGPGAGDYKINKQLDYDQ